jgi:hypothetical protein
MTSINQISELLNEELENTSNNVTRTFVNQDDNVTIATTSGHVAKLNE